MSKGPPISGRALTRVQKELVKFQADASSELAVSVISDSVWHVRLTTPVDTVFLGESYTLKIQFSNEYPMESPIVVFHTPSPEHPHVYSNGHICLNILYDEWSPALTAKNICLSILSMLSSCPEKGRPEDNDSYVRRTPSNRNPKKTSFIYHDDTV